MDRPEDFEANPKTGKVYVALTNNDERGAAGEAPPDAANPRNDNKSGQILEITDNHAGTDFTWDLLLVCGDPAAADTYFAGFDKTKVSPISCPDNLAFDSHGNLWISTDGNALDSNDGLFAVALEGPNRGETKQFLTVPLGAETCGPDHHRRSGHRVRAAPGRARRQQHRQPAVALARRRQRNGAAVGGRGVEGRRQYRRVVTRERDLPNSYRRATAAATLPEIQPHPRRGPTLRGHRRRRRLQLGPLLPALRRPRRRALRMLDDAGRLGRADVAHRVRRAGDLQLVPQPGTARRHGTHRRPHLRRATDPRHRLGLEAAATTTSTATSSARRAAGSTNWPPRCRGSSPGSPSSIPHPTRDIPILIGGQGEKKTLRMVAEYADHLARLRRPGDLSPQGRDPGGALRRRRPRPRDHRTLGRCAGQRPMRCWPKPTRSSTSASPMLTVGVNGPDYDLSDAEALCRWRDRRQSMRN